MRKITVEQKAELIERYRAGEDAGKLADEYGLSVRTVQIYGARPGMQGFRGMDPERQREIASMGGTRAQESSRAHRYTTEEARVAGQKGGRKVAEDRAHMAEIGAKGGRKSGGRK